MLGSFVNYSYVVRVRSQQSENSAVSNLLMSGWKEEEENGMNM
jgi:hypothetical protein